MLGMNRATLLGYAGKHPEMRKLPSGDDVAQFSLATTERFRRKDDTVGESTEWHAVVAFGAAAEAVRKLVRKGDPVLVEGRISTRSWTDRKGVERRTTEIVVSGARGLVNVLARRRKDDGGGDDPPGGTAARAGAGAVDEAAEAAAEATAKAVASAGAEAVPGDEARGTDAGDEGRGAATGNERGGTAGEAAAEAAAAPGAEAEPDSETGSGAGKDGGKAGKAGDATRPSADGGDGRE